MPAADAPRRGSARRAPKPRTPKRIADPKVRAPAPPPRRSPIFSRGLPQPGAKIERARSRAQVRHGEALARTPGVKARLRPQPKGSSADQRVRGAYQGAKGLTSEQRQAIIRTRTPAGRALRSAQAVSDRDTVRQLRRAGLRVVEREAVKGVRNAPARDQGLRESDFTPAGRRELARIGAGTITNQPVKGGKKRKRIGIGPASVDITHTGAKIMDQVASGHGGALRENVIPFAGRTVEGARRFPQDAARSFYEQGAAAVELAQGRPERAKRVLKGYTEGVVGRAVQGDLKGALKTFSDNPFAGALELSGAYAVAGRAAGAAARSGALGRGAKRAGQTRRNALRVAPGIQVPRSYSKNIITAGFQKRREAGLRLRGIDPDQARPSKLPFRGQDHLLNKHADEFNSVVEVKRRQGRELSTREALRSIPTRGDYDLSKRSGRAKAAVARSLRQPRTTVRGRLVTARPEQFVLATVAEQARRKGDVLPVLRAERARLEAVYQREARGPNATMSARAQALNRANASAIDAFLRSPRAVARTDQLWDAVKRYDAAINPRTQRLVDLKVLDPEQARNATLRPIAVAQMGGSFDARRQVHPAAQAQFRVKKAQATAARQAARRAQEAHAQARVARGRLAGVQAVQRGRGSGKLKMAAGAAQPTRATSVLAYIDDVQRQAESLKGQATVEARHRAVMDAADKRVQQAREARSVAEQAARAAEKEAAAAKPKPQTVGLVDPSGVRLSAAEIDRRLADEAGGFAAGERAYYRGSRDSGIRMGTRGDWWDRHTFMSHDRAVADSYTGKGGSVEAIAVRPGAKILERDTPEFAALLEREGLHRDESTKIAQAAERAGYDVVDFKVPDLGAIVLNERAIRRDVRPRPVERGPSFVGQSDVSRGAKAAFVNAMAGRRNVDQHRRTGEATRLYGGDPHPARIVDTVMRAQGVIDAVESWDRWVSTVGIRDRNGAPFTPARAEAFLSGRGDGEVKLVPVRLAPAAYKAERAADIMDTLQSGLPLPDDFMLGLVNDRFAMAAVPDLNDLPSDARIALVPEASYKRQIAHQERSSSEIAKAFQKVTAVFRGTVLPFSFKWFFGNVAEATFRLAMEGALPVYDARIGARLLKAMVDEDQKRVASMRRGFDDADAFRLRTSQGLLYGTADNLTIHRDRNSFEGTVMKPTAAALGAAADFTPIRGILAALHGYQRGAFAFNKMVENGMIRHATGKLARRQVQEFTGSWLKSLRMSDDAIRELARGMLDSNAQAQFARQLDDVLGQYQRFSPEVKRTIQTVTPFLPWYLNAAKFVYYTLPAKHPIKTALLVRTSETFQQDYDEDNKDLPPGDLRSAIVRPDGGLVNASRYSPFGAFTGLAPGIFFDPFLPQLASIYNIGANRLSFTGKKLQVEPGENGEKRQASDLSEGEIIALALYSAFESTFPGFQILRRAQEGGNTPYDNSTFWDPKTKPNSSYGSSAFRRIVDPLRPTYLRPPARATSRQKSDADLLLEDPTAVQDTEASDADLLLGAG